ncbi:MAG TPA: acyltransferase family protein [Candidatus Ventricola gallistercoris]|nr:acyltransferase family protein [Candidatus Ventricola gallistercoris]
MTRDKTENFTFRALYLIAILFVVDGHIPLGEMLNWGGLFRYYSFHLMLFAFGSGYFFSRRGGVAAQIRKSAVRLLVPLYIYNALYGILALLLRRFAGATLGAPLSAYTLMLAPLTDGQHFAYNLGAWFLFPLFLARTVYLLLDRLLARVRWRETVALVLCLIPGVLAVSLCRAGRQGAVPLFVLRTAILLPGYAFGVLYRARLERWDRLPTVPYLTGIVVLRALLCTRYENLAYLLSDCSYFGCDAFGVYAGGAMAIAFYLRLARLLAPCVQKSRLALFVSRHTFDVMMHHYLGFYALNCVFLAVHILGLGAADFSVNSLRTVSGYVYTPGGRSEWAVLYLIAGVLFSCGVAVAMRWLSVRASGLMRRGKAVLSKQNR